jgi:hypothetical protein
MLTWRWIFPWPRDVEIMKGVRFLEEEEEEEEGGGVLHGRFGNRGPSGKMVGGGGGCVGVKLC